MDRAWVVEYPRGIDTAPPSPQKTASLSEVQRNGLMELPKVPGKFQVLRQVANCWFEALSGEGARGVIDYSLCEVVSMPSGGDSSKFEHLLFRSSFLCYNICQALKSPDDMVASAIVGLLGKTIVLHELCEKLVRETVILMTYETAFREDSWPSAIFAAIGRTVSTQTLVPFLRCWSATILEDSRSGTFVPERLCWHVSLFFLFVQEALPQMWMIRAILVRLLVQVPAEWHRHAFSSLWMLRVICPVIISPDLHVDHVQVSSAEWSVLSKVAGLVMRISNGQLFDTTHSQAISNTFIEHFQPVYTAFYESVLDVVRPNDPETFFVRGSSSSSMTQTHLRVLHYHATMNRTILSELMTANPQKATMFEEALDDAGAPHPPVKHIQEEQKKSNKKSADSAIVSVAEKPLKTCMFIFGSYCEMKTRTGWTDCFVALTKNKELHVFSTVTTIRPLINALDLGVGIIKDAKSSNPNAVNVEGWGLQLKLNLPSQQKIERLRSLVQGKTDEVSQHMVPKTRIW